MEKREQRNGNAAVRLAESEWRQVRKSTQSAAQHPSARAIGPKGDEAGLRAVEWSKARPTDHLNRKGHVGSRQGQQSQA